MDTVSSPPPPPSEHLRYVRCTYCNTVLAVGVPSKRLMETVTVKCGHCNHLSFLSPRPPPPLFQTLCSDNHVGFQGSCMECSRKGQHNHHHLSLQSSSSSSSAATCSSSAEPAIPKAPFVVKPPEKKHRLPSAYNRFMKEEIQRIKAAKPDIPHREAFSMAAKNWAKCDPRGSIGSSADRDSAFRAAAAAQQHLVVQERGNNGFNMVSFSALKQQVDQHHK